MALSPKAKKILMWSGIGAGALVLAIGIWLLILYISAGAEYEHELETLVPAQALYVTRIDNLKANWGDFDEQLETFISKQDNALKKLCAAPLYTSLFQDEPKDAAGKPLPVKAQPRQPVPTLKQLHEEKLRGTIEDARGQVSQMPGGLDLFEDLIGKQVVVAMMGERGSDKTRPLIFTRVSRSVKFGWKFRGWGEGRNGSTTIADASGILTITTEHEDGTTDETHLALLDDVLVIAKNPDDITAVRELHDADGAGESYAAQAGYAEALEEVQAVQQENGGFVRQFANLNSIRAWQGPDKDDSLKRAKVDQVFDLSPEVISMSPEIMPSLNEIYRRAIDMRAFSFAVWSFALGRDGLVEADQFLIIDTARLKKHDYLKPGLQQKPAKLDVLDVLPQGTWMIALDREPFSALKDAVKPQVGDDGRPKEDAIYSFFKSLGNDPKIEAAGIAMLASKYQPNPQDKNKVPPPVVSPVAFPAFAVLLNWPGVKFNDADALLRETLREQGAKNIVTRRASLGDAEYTTFALLEDDPNSTLKWLTQFAAFTINDYLVLCYSDNHSAVQDFFTAARDKSRSMRAAGNSSLAQWAAKQASTLTFFDPAGLAEYARRVNLAPVLSDKKFNPARPFNRELRDIAAEEAKKLGTTPADPRVSGAGGAVEKIKAEWVAQRGPFEREFNANIAGLTALQEFTAVTTKSLKRMHTRYEIRLGK